MRRLLLLRVLVIVALLLPLAAVAQIIVTTPGLPNGETTLVYQPVQLTATGGTGTYQWSVTGGTLPPGLTLSSGGILTGTPRENGSFPVTVQAADGTSSPGTRALSLQVKLHGAPLTGTKSAAVSGTTGPCCGIQTINGNGNQNQTIVGAGGITVTSANGVTTINGAGLGGGGIQSINGNTNPNQTITGTGAAVVTSSNGNTNVNVPTGTGGNPVLSSIAVTPTSVQGGNTSIGTAILTAPAPAGGALVTLASSNTAAAQVPAGVNIAANGTTSNFNVTTSPVTSNTSVTIEGNYGVTQTANLTVTAPPPPPAPIYGGVGQPGATATVVLSGTNVVLSTGDVLAQLQTTPEQVGQSWQFSPNLQVIYLLLTGASHTFVDQNNAPFPFAAPITVNLNGRTLYLYQSQFTQAAPFTIKVAS